VKAATILGAALVTLAGCAVDGGHLYFSRPDRAFVDRAYGLLHATAALVRRAPFASSGARDSLEAAWMLFPMDEPSPTSAPLVRLKAAIAVVLEDANTLRDVESNPGQFQGVVGEGSPEEVKRAREAEVLDRFSTDCLKLCVWERKAFGSSIVFDDAFGSQTSLIVHGRTMAPWAALRMADSLVTAQHRFMPWWARP
jgi:hypothetical protein